MTTINQQKEWGVEILKVFAAIMITNAHSKCLYPDSISVLGTFGVPGNALFFLVSGYTLGLKSKTGLFLSWYKRRIARIWPTLVVWTILLAPIFFYKSITWQKIFLAQDYWFLQCIAIYYILYYIINHFFQKRLLFFILVTSLVPVIIFFFCGYIKGSVFENLKYITHFGIMLLGAWFAQNREKVKGNLLKDSALAILWFVAFYAVQIKGKGSTGLFYYMQITGIVPLTLFAYHSLKAVHSRDFSFISNGILGVFIRMIGALTLEIYIVNTSVINTHFNHLFPLNLIIIFILIVACAFFLRVCTRFLVQTINIDQDYNWGNMFRF